MDERSIESWFKLTLLKGVSNKWSQNIAEYNSTKTVYGNDYIEKHINNITHCRRKPAMRYYDGTVKYIINNKLHRVNGPAVIGLLGKEYWVDGNLHRVNGPAINFYNDCIEYWVDGKLHRVNGPAIIFEDGSVEYWVDGKRHRDHREGPAIIHEYGRAEYWEDNIRLDHLRGSRHFLMNPPKN